MHEKSSHQNSRNYSNMKQNNMLLKTILLTCTLLCIFKWTLTAGDTCTYRVWSDEFTYEGAPDPEKWGYDTGGDGWGNQELQYYTDSRDNSLVKDGILTIKAIKTNGNWTSARLVTKGKGDWLTGRIEVSAKLPSGRGTWPAIWMLPTNQVYGTWPKSGEIDIMEHVGYDMGTIHGTIHTEAYNHSIGTQLGGSVDVENAASQFHVYAIDWTEEEIIWYVDGAEYFRVENPDKTYKEWPFDQKFHLILNIAIGGTWGGAEGIDPELDEATMEIDYVRVFQKEIPEPTIETKKKNVRPGEELTFSTIDIPGVRYQWSFPGEVEVLEGDTSAQVTVQWGETSGNVGLKLFSACDTVYAEAYTVNVTLSPTGDRFEIPWRDEQSQMAWTAVPGSSNQISLEATEQLTVDYQINETSENPYILYEFPGRIDLSTHPKLEITLKTPQPVPGSFRIDLVDENDHVNLNDLFKITSFESNGEYHTYSYEFGQNPDGIYNLASIKEIRIYINYGIFGKEGNGQVEISSLAFLSPGTGISRERTKGKLQAWPNPFQDEITIAAPQMLETVEIFDRSGRLVRQKSAINNRRAVLHLSVPPGHYFLRSTSTTGKTQVIQIIKAPGNE